MTTIQRQIEKAEQAATDGQYLFAVEHLGYAISELEDQIRKLRKRKRKPTSPEEGKGL